MSGRRRDTLAAGILASVLVAGTLALVWIVQARQPDPVPVPGRLLVLGCLLSIAGCVPVAVRRRWPVAGLFLATALVLTCAAVAVVSLGPAMGMLVGAYTVAMMLRWQRSAPVLVAAAGLHAAGGILITRQGGDVRGLPTFWGVPGQDLDAMITATVASYAIPGAIGALVRRRRAHTAALTRRAERLEAERAERDQAAAEAERGRIARELHDIAAHDLSAIVVQAGAADRLVTGDPDAAKEVLRNIRGQGRDTLAALRQLVGVLRDDDAGGRAPQPGLARVDDLFAVARAAGTNLTVTVDGDPGPLSRQADLAAFRIIQEALTNARRHAEGQPVTVRIVHDAGVRLEIANPVGLHGRVGSGHGLAGMRERTRQAGGAFTAGPVADGRWLVAASLPESS
jgi:signal transduction histidine kinase